MSPPHNRPLFLRACMCVLINIFVFLLLLIVVFTLCKHNLSLLLVQPSQNCVFVSRTIIIFNKICSSFHFFVCLCDDALWRLGQRFSFSAALLVLLLLEEEIQRNKLSLELVAGRCYPCFSSFSDQVLQLDPCFEGIAIVDRSLTTLNLSPEASFSCGGHDLERVDVGEE